MTRVVNRLMTPSVLVAIPLSLLIAAGTIACGSEDAAPARPSEGAAQGEGAAGSSERVSGAEARRLVAEENAFILDVRTPGEFGGGHVDGATNIPVSELGQRVSEVPADRPVVVYCHSGGRSASAASILASAGRTVYDFGRFSAW